ncbi:hypothetical protein JCM24511_06952 [Saitozyma sp. JCM 24511]|nr:hypothetical protein JCM24511_06952 [Saitozyma sp. JCM 24511]
MAHDVAAFLARRSLRSGVHLVGHSMGAKMAMALALDHRLNLALRSLTVVDMAPTTEPIEPQYADYARGMMEIEASKVATMREADAILQKYESTAATRQFLLTNAVNVRDPSGVDPPHLRFRCALPILAEGIATLGDFPHETSDVDPLAAPSVCWAGPTLFLRGGKSDYLTPRNIPAAQHFFPRSKISTIPRAGHWVHADAPEETTKSISNFVRDALG